MFPGWTIRTEGKNKGFTVFYNNQEIGWCRYKAAAKKMIIEYRIGGWK